MKLIKFAHTESIPSGCCRECFHFHIQEGNGGWTGQCRRTPEFIKIERSTRTKCNLFKQKPNCHYCKNYQEKYNRCILSNERRLYSEYCITDFMLINTEEEK